MSDPNKEVHEAIALARAEHDGEVARGNFVYNRRSTESWARVDRVAAKAVYIQTVASRYPEHLKAVTTKLNSWSWRIKVLGRKLLRFVLS